MKPSLLNKLDGLQDRFEELTALLGDAEVISDQARFRAYSREYAEVEPVIGAYRQLRKVQADLEGAQALLKDSDPDLREMAEQDLVYERQSWPREDAKAFFAGRGEPLKVQLIDEKTEGQATVSCYTIKDRATFVDFCTGPHVPSTGRLKAFKLLSTSNAYWKGDARNQPMQRVYGTAFFKDDELKAHLTQIEEAKKRDHRKLGKDLGLFMFHQWAPGGAFWLGADFMGRDMYSRVVHGARISLAVGAGAMGLGALIGISVGLASGYLGGWFDLLVQRLLDIMQALPLLVMAIVMAASLGPSLRNTIIAIAIPLVPTVARVVRSNTLSLREQPFVEAARAVGMGELRIAVRHVLPNTLAPLIVQSTYIAASAILTEAGLSFLGVGVPPEIPSWGNIIAQGRSFFLIAPWSILIPGAFLAVLNGLLPGDEAEFAAHDILPCLGSLAEIAAWAAI